MSAKEIAELNLPLPPNTCECLRPGKYKTSNREPVCQQCHDMAKAELYQNAANRTNGIRAPKKERIGPTVKWETYYDYILGTGEPIAGGSLAVLDEMLERIAA